ncbi:pleckstrin-like domain-containing protein [Phthorimaea operculella]|nr:pleckstrin-like domain-containing protein [Phthorimaea operculella]
MPLGLSPPINEFSKAVAEEYVKHFDFANLTLDAALRQFLARFALSGETQERERVLVHFSRRFLECNPGSFNSQDAVHTLTCAIMLLNTDLHSCAGGSGGAFRRMTCAEFIENLTDLNDGENFPRETLKLLYHNIRTQPLEWALDTDTAPAPETRGSGPVGSNPFLDVPDQARAVEYKKGYVMRKCCVDPNGKKTPFGRRGWKMFYCTLRDLVLYLHKDEHGFRRSQISDNLHNAIRIHHALATKATDYTKKQHVFRLQTADQAEYLFQTSDSKELCSWVETINFVCAAYSAPPLAAAVGSTRKFQRPLLPASHTKLNMREQLTAHEERAAQLEEELAALRHARDNTPHSRDKEHYLIYEIKRYRTYAYVMRARAGGAGAEDAAPACSPRACCDAAGRRPAPPHTPPSAPRY